MAGLGRGWYVLSLLLVLVANLAVSVADAADAGVANATTGDADSAEADAGGSGLEPVVRLGFWRFLLGALVMGGGVVVPLVWIAMKNKKSFQWTRMD